MTDIVDSHQQTVQDTVQTVHTTVPTVQERMGKVIGVRFQVTLTRTLCKHCDVSVVNNTWREG